MKTTEIKNWKELRDTWGLEEAKYVSKNLQGHTEKHILIGFRPSFSGADCIFELVEETDTSFVYEYQGTVM